MTGLSLRIIREYDAEADVWPIEPLMPMKPRDLSPWEELHRDAFPVDPNAPPKCCDGINDSHTQLCQLLPWAEHHTRLVCWTECCFWTLTFCLDCRERLA